MTNYEVAVMNYPLFYQNTPEDASIRLLSPPFHTDEGGPWETSMYIHIPFCGSLCDFCVYNRMLAPGNKEVVEAFVDALIREIGIYARSERVAGTKIAAVFLGGGTPSVLSKRQLERILQALHKAFDLRGCEMTVECNPLNATREKLTVLKENGVTRVSAGIQSFRDSIRKTYHIARLSHSVELWLDMLRDFHFDDESLDILYGFPGTGIEELLRDVQHAIDRGMGHISLYKLVVFAYTKLYKDLDRRPSDKLPDAESCFSMFRAAHRLLLQSGYTLQSVQEYGKAGKSTRFWDTTYDGFGDNIAIGVSSFGYLNGYCYQNAESVEEYIKPLQNDRLPVERISAQITPEQLRERAVIMGFRKGRVLRNPFFDAFHISMDTVFEEPLRRLAEDGLIANDPEGYVLTEKGLYHQGNVSAELMVSLFRGVSALRKKMCIGSHTMP